MRSDPLVSIVIPCYNQGHYLAAAIESCLHQTVTDIEVLVVDDGSTDNTEAVLNDFGARDSRVRALSGVNVGLGAARNRGLGAARGQYLNFLDADDLLAPNKLERQVSVLEGRPDIGLVLCDVDSIDEQHERILAPGIRLDRIEHPDGLLPAILEAGLFPPHVPLVRASLVRSVGGFSEDRTLAGHADYLLWLTLALEGVRVAIVPEVLASYRRVPGSMSTDTTHMASSRAKALTFAAARYPERFADGVMAISGSLSDARYANAILQRQLEVMADRGLERELARLTFENWALRHSDRRIYIWGAGSKGREVLETVRSLGVQPVAFVDSAAGSNTTQKGIPIEPPSTLASRDAAVIVASIYHPEIVADLEARGVTDYCVAP